MVRFYAAHVARLATSVTLKPFPPQMRHVGCAEAVSGGWALVQSLQLSGYDVQTVSDVAQLARDGDAVAMQHVRDSAQVVGYAVANAVSLLNPDAVIIAGELLGAGEQIIATIRETIYQQSLPLATHDLTLMPSRLGPLVGLRGGAQLGIETLLNDPSNQQEAEFSDD